MIEAGYNLTQGVVIINGKARDKILLQMGEGYKICYQNRREGVKHLKPITTKVLSL